MSKDNAIRFVDAARGDSVIQKQLSAATRPSDIVKIGADHGYAFTAEEIRDVRSELEVALSRRSGELSDAELEQAAGGVRTVSFSDASASFAVRGSGGSDVCTDNAGGSPITCVKMPDWETINITCD
jgi:predicted ribosomally synthesized peptide with nif11-like leader